MPTVTAIMLPQSTTESPFLSIKPNAPKRTTLQSIRALGKQYGLSHTELRQAARQLHQLQRDTVNLTRNEMNAVLHLPPSTDVEKLLETGGITKELLAEIPTGKDIDRKLIQIGLDKRQAFAQSVRRIFSSFHPKI